MKDLPKRPIELTYRSMYNIDVKPTAKELRQRKVDRFRSKTQPWHWQPSMSIVADSVATRTITPPFITSKNTTETNWSKVNHVIRSMAARRRLTAVNSHGL